MRECINCIYSSGLGSDVWCEHNPKGKESYMCETDCEYFKSKKENNNKRFNIFKSKEDIRKNHKDKVLGICNNLKKLGVITEIEERRYSIDILIRCDDEYEEDSYFIRDRIKSNFEKEGFSVDIKGTYWLEIIYVDLRRRIDDCFI